MEKDKNKKKKKKNFGLNRSTVTMIGLLLLALGAMGRGIIRTRFLGMGLVDSNQLLEILNASGGMQAAAAALALEGLESCAAPIFAVLLIDGFRKTSNWGRYFLRVLGVAVISEIPYNYVFSGKYGYAFTKSGLEHGPMSADALPLSILQRKAVWQDSDKACSSNSSSALVLAVLRAVRTTHAPPCDGSLGFA